MNQNAYRRTEVYTAGQQQPLSVTPLALAWAATHPSLEQRAPACTTLLHGGVECLAYMENPLPQRARRAPEVDFLVVCCSIFNPTPSLSAMIVNHFKMKSSVITYNLSGMGCSAGLIAIGLVRELLQARARAAGTAPPPPAWCLRRSCGSAGRGARSAGVAGLL